MTLKLKALQGVMKIEKNFFRRKENKRVGTEEVIDAPFKFSGIAFDTAFNF